MPWIESHQEIKDHPKTILLAKMMGWSLNETIGILHRFWWWCVDYAEDGDLRKYTEEQLAYAVGLEGELVRQFTESMIKSGWIDCKPFLHVHDWWNYIRRFLQSKYSHEPKKWQKIKRLYGIRSKQLLSNCLATAKQLTPNLTKPNLTKPNLTKPNQVDTNRNLVSTLVPTDFDKSVRDCLLQCQIIKIPDCQLQKLIRSWLIYRDQFDLCQTIQQADAWLIANKRIKKNYGRFLTNWFNRTLDKGGINDKRPTFTKITGNASFHPRAAPGKYDKFESSTNTK